MVVRLEGKVQGQDVIFNHIQGDDWEAVIPAVSSGIYIVSLNAWDDAGNMAYTSKYIITIDLSALRICLEPYLYWIELLSDKYSSQISCSEYYAELLKGVS